MFLLKNGIGHLLLDFIREIFIKNIGLLQSLEVRDKEWILVKLDLKPCQNDMQTSIVLERKAR